MTSKNLMLLGGIVVFLLGAFLLGLSGLGVERVPVTATVTALGALAALEPAPSATPLLPTPTPQPERLSSPPSMLNGVPLDTILVLSPAARAHLREIFAAGARRGRNARAFSKVGDSTMEYPPFLAAFDNAKQFKLGAYVSLQPAVSYYQGSFTRSSAAVKRGMHTWTEFDPSWANPELCSPGETPLDCEMRLNNPAIAIIRLGANDVVKPEAFQEQIRKIADYCISNGVIPVLGTKPDRQEGPENTLNNLVRKTAATYALPLWDYDLIAATVPDRGLEADKIHMRGGGSHDYTSPQALQAGDSLEDLTALMMLDLLRRELAAPQEAIP